ncbi:glycosyltransferase family 39 protein [Granulicella sp. S156]|uniref:ArnT family glycosyltransferase n=1 Tax=Granulicella sp. S156 TaxID=1747224 RepID=UPI0015753051|nr:glycosyltransferase family 39 protein [Granulicella sp. S156]
MTDTPQLGTSTPRSKGFTSRFGPRWLRELAHTHWGCSLWELAVLLGVSAYFLFFGLVPYIGGDQLGLVGADEPRYAQIAREMLAAHSADCHEVHARITPHSLRPTDIHASYVCLMGGTVTPILYGKPWLEKPALYYWRAMSFFKEFGVSDWSARLPSASGAGALIILAFLHLRRFRPGGHLDAALIMVSCVAIVAFARGASTDMQLAAPFCIGMLGWYGWYETGKKFWLFDLYFFGAAATLAKGPIAPFMMLGILLLFCGLRREWSALRRTIWFPGILLYLAMVLPWYIAVQRRNPSFFRQFFLEHNLERFATNRYQHHQPIYFYLVVLILGLMPWTAIAFRALVDAIQISIAEWKVRHNPRRYLGHTRAGDAFPEFLVLWALFPVVFFSFSGSKLPGYILPSIPPLAILTGDYLFRIRRAGMPSWLLYLHAGLTGLVTFVLLLCPQYMVYQRIVPAAKTFAWTAVLGVLAALLIVFVVRRYGVRHVRTATLIPLAGLLFFLMKLNGPLLDLNYSARPLAREIQKAAPDVQIVAVYHVRRDLDYGLAFYRNQNIVHYVADREASVGLDDVGVPDEEHVLVIPTRDADRVPTLLQGRVYQQLFLYETQGLSVYKVYPRS